MLSLPWPPSILSPNNRSHWARKAKVKAKFRSDCFYITKHEMRNGVPTAVHSEGSLHLSMTFHPPTRRHYDIDNLLASMKSGLDGVADAWGVNDTRFRPITIDFGDVIKGGLIKLKIL